MPEELERKLPKYIVECFKVTGFDTPIAISKMRVVGEKNSIKDLEEYIEKWKEFLQNCMGPNMAPFQFPPSHIITIVSTILDFQKRLGCGLNHGEVKAKPSKKRKIESNTDADNNKDDIPAVKADSLHDNATLL